MERKKKVTTLDEAMQIIRNGQTIAIGGFLLQNHPMALVREIIKRGIKNLKLISPPTGGSIETDILLGAGCVNRLVCSYVGAEWLCPVLPNYRRILEAGELEEVMEYDELYTVCALNAAAQGLPSFHTRLGLGTDIIKANQELKVFPDPIDPQVEWVAIPPLKPDVALIHAQQSDIYGNCRIALPFWDDVIASAADKVIVSADTIISLETTMQEPHQTTIHGHRVDAVVEIPYGAHPFSSGGIYNYDEQHLREYIAAAKDKERFKEYLQQYIYGVDSIEDYLEQAGGVKKLFQLRK